MLPPPLLKRGKGMKEEVGPVQLRIMRIEGVILAT
jgi:hypothetical protein